MTTRRNESPGRRDGAGAGVLVLAGLLVLVVAASVGSERSDLGEGGSPLVGQILGGVLVGGFVALSAIGVWLLLFRRELVRLPRGRGGPVVPWWLRSLVVIGLLLLVVVVALLIGGRRPPPVEDAPPTTSVQDANGEGEGANGLDDQGSSGPSAAFYAGIVLAMAAVVMGAVRVARNGPTFEDDEDGDDDELVLAGPVQAAAEASLDALHNEPDPRRAVIAAYARVQAQFAGQGLPRHVSETEPEYLARVLRHYGAAAEPARRLTDLFEVARYSAADVDEQMRAEAIDAATALRDSAMDQAGHR